MRLLGVRARKDIYRAATVKSLSRPDSIKGMLMIEDRELDDQELRMIAAVSPGCTVNFVTEGKVVRKLLLRLPSRVEGISGMLCTNQGCITRPEHQERVRPIMVRFDEKSARCHYCDNVISSSHMF